MLCLTCLDCDTVCRCVLWCTVPRSCSSGSTTTARYCSPPAMAGAAPDLHPCQVFHKRPYGMGAGMRKLICRWYQKQDPFDLALEVIIFSLILEIRF